MGDEHEAREQLQDTAHVFRVRRQLDAAIADLASRPLDEHTADQMREILDSPDLAGAREAWSRILTTKPPAPVLRLVPTAPEATA